MSDRRTDIPTDVTDEALDSKGWRDRYVRDEVERLVREGQENPDRGGRPEDRLARLERIAERDSARHLPDFSPESVRALEDVEIRTAPEAFLRRHAGEGLDPATEREVRKALADRQPVTP